MICGNCKANLPGTAKFCNICGAKVNVSFCPNGHVLDSEDAFCRYCPPLTVKDESRISVSTTIEKFSHPAAIDSAKATCIESDAVDDDAAPSAFGTTRIINEKMKEPCALLGWLVIIDGAEKWRDFRIMKTKTTIGRSRGCDIILEHSDVSAKHASLRLHDEGLFLADLDSSNGTFINDQPVTKQKLSDNDLIRIGDITMKFRSF